MHKQIKLSVVVQAGGESRRMGQDKALMPFLGRPLIQRVVERLSPLASELVVVTNRPLEFRFLELPLYEDLLPGRGALGGLYTALSVAGLDLVAVVACDMPFANPALLEALCLPILRGEADAVLPTTPQGMEPFHAVYSRSVCLPAVRSTVEEGRWKANSWLHLVRVHYFTPEQIVEYDTQGRAFWNLNTLEDFERAEKLARDELSVE